MKNLSNNNLSLNNVFDLIKYLNNDELFDCYVCDLKQYMRLSSKDCEL
jgi:hypothetical protein